MASDNETSCASDPNFAVICSFLEKFAKSCGITHPNMLELQEMLENTQEVPQPLIDLHVKLLRKARKSVSGERWEKAIIKFCHSYSNQDGWEIERFGYKKARISVKLRILKMLLELQFDMNAKFKTEVNRLSADELRCQPLGRDKMGQTYWCQLDEDCNLRVYREDLDDETWEVVARDRDGLVQLISQLSSNDPFRKDTEAILNEDSNSLEIEKPITDTGQTTDLREEAAESHDEYEESELEEDIPDDKNHKIHLEAEKKGNNINIAEKQKTDNSCTEKVLVCDTEVDSLLDPKEDSRDKGRKEESVKPLQQPSEKDGQRVMIENIEVKADNNTLKGDYLNKEREENYSSEIKNTTRSEVQDSCSVEKGENFNSIREVNVLKKDGRAIKNEDVVEKDDDVKVGDGMKKDNVDVKNNDNDNLQRKDVGIKEKGVGMKKESAAIKEESFAMKREVDDLKKDDGMQKEDINKRGDDNIKKDDIIKKVDFIERKVVGDSVTKANGDNMKEASDSVKKEVMEHRKKDDCSHIKEDGASRNKADNSSTNKNDNHNPAKEESSYTKKENILKTEKDDSLSRVSEKSDGCGSEKTDKSSTEREDILNTKLKSEYNKKTILQMVTSTKLDSIVERIPKIEEIPLSFSSKGTTLKPDKLVLPSIKTVSLQGNIRESDYIGMDLSKPSRSRPTESSLLSTVGIDLSSKTYKEERNLQILDKMEELNESSTSSSSLVAEDLSDVSKRLQPSAGTFEQNRFAPLPLIATDLSTKRVVPSDLHLAPKVPILNVVSDFGSLSVNRLNLSGKRLHESDLLTNEAKKLRLEQTVAANCHKMMSSASAARLSHFDSGSFDSEDSAEVGEAIEEPLMLVRGEGSGADCNTGNPGKDGENGKGNNSKNDQITSEENAAKKEKCSVSDEQGAVSTSKTEIKDGCELSVEKSRSSVYASPGNSDGASAIESSNIPKGEKEIEKPTGKMEQNDKDLLKVVTDSDTEPEGIVKSSGISEKVSGNLEFSSDSLKTTDPVVLKISSLEKDAPREGELLSLSPPKQSPKLWSIETICAPDGKAKDCQKIGISGSKNVGNSLLGIVSDSLYGERYNAESVGRLNPGSSSPAKRPSRWDVGGVGKPQNKGEAECNTKGNILQSEFPDNGDTLELKKEVKETKKSACVEEHDRTSDLSTSLESDVTATRKINVDSRVQVCQKQKFKFDIENIITINEKKGEKMSSLKPTIHDIKANPNIDKLQIAGAVSDTRRPESSPWEKAEMSECSPSEKLAKKDESDGSASNSGKLPVHGFFFGPGCLLKSPIKKAAESLSLAKDSEKASIKTAEANLQESAVTSSEPTLVVTRSMESSPKGNSTSSTKSSNHDLVSTTKNEPFPKTNTSHSIDTIMKSPCKPRDTIKFPLQTNFSSEITSELDIQLREEKTVIENKLLENKEILTSQDTKVKASHLPDNSSLKKLGDQLTSSSSSSYILKEKYSVTEAGKVSPKSVSLLKGDLKKCSELHEKVEKDSSKTLINLDSTIVTEECIVKKSSDFAVPLNEVQLDKESIPKQLSDDALKAKDEHQTLSTGKIETMKILKPQQEESSDLKIIGKVECSTMQMTNPGNVTAKQKVPLPPKSLSGSSHADKLVGKSQLSATLSKIEKKFSASKVQQLAAFVPSHTSKDDVINKYSEDILSMNEQNSMDSDAERQQLTNLKCVKPNCPKLLDTKASATNVSQVGLSSSEKMDSELDGKNVMLSLPVQISATSKDPLTSDPVLCTRRKELDSNTTITSTWSTSLNVNTKSNIIDKTKGIIGSLLDDPRKKLVKEHETISGSIDKMETKSVALDESVNSSVDEAKTSACHIDVIDKSKSVDDVGKGTLKPCATNMPPVDDEIKHLTSAVPELIRDPAEKSEMKSIPMCTVTKQDKLGSSLSTKLQFDINKDNISNKPHVRENVFESDSISRVSNKMISMLDSDRNNENMSTIETKSKKLDTSPTGVFPAKSSTTIKSGISLSSSKVEKTINETVASLKGKTNEKPTTALEEKTGSKSTTVSTEKIFNESVKPSANEKKISHVKDIAGSFNMSNKSPQSKSETNLSYSVLEHETNVKNIISIGNEAESGTACGFGSKSRSLSQNKICEVKSNSADVNTDRLMSAATSQTTHENKLDTNSLEISHLLECDLKPLSNKSPLKIDNKSAVLTEQSVTLPTKISADNINIKSKVAVNVTQSSEIKPVNTLDQVKNKSSVSSTEKAEDKQIMVCTSKIAVNPVGTSKDNLEVKPINKSEHISQVQIDVCGSAGKDKDVEIKSKSDKMNSNSATAIKAKPVDVGKEEIVVGLSKEKASSICVSGGGVKQNKGYINEEKIKFDPTSPTQNVTESIKSIEAKSDSSLKRVEIACSPTLIKDEQKSANKAKICVANISQTSKISDSKDQTSNKKKCETKNYDSINETKDVISSKSKTCELSADKNSAKSLTTKDKLKSSVENDETKPLQVKTPEEGQSSVVCNISSEGNLPSKVNVPVTSVPKQDSSNVASSSKANEKCTYIPGQKVMTSTLSKSENNTTRGKSDKLDPSDKPLNLEKSEFALEPSQKSNSTVPMDKKLVVIQEKSSVSSQECVLKDIKDSEQKHFKYSESPKPIKGSDENNHLVNPQTASANISSMKTTERMFKNAGNEITKTSKLLDNTKETLSTNILEEKHNIPRNVQLKESKNLSPGKSEANVNLPVSIQTSQYSKELPTVQCGVKEIESALIENPTLLQDASIPVASKMKFDSKDQDSEKCLNLSKDNSEVRDEISSVSSQEAKSSTKSLSASSPVVISASGLKTVLANVTIDSSSEFQSPVKDPIKSTISSKLPPAKGAMSLTSKTKFDSQNKGRRKSLESISMGIMMGKVAAKSSLQEPMIAGNAGENESKQTEEISNKGKVVVPSAIQSLERIKELEKLKSKKISLESKETLSLTGMIEPAIDITVPNPNLVSHITKQIEIKEYFQLSDIEKLKSVEQSPAQQDKSELKKKDLLSETLNQVDSCSEKDKVSVKLNTDKKEEQKSLLLQKKRLGDNVKGRDTSLEEDYSSERLTPEESSIEKSPIHEKPGFLSCEKQTKRGPKNENKSEAIEKKTDENTLFVTEICSNVKKSTCKESISFALEESKKISKVTSLVKERNSDNKESTTPKKSFPTASEEGKSKTSDASAVEEKHLIKKESLTSKESNTIVAGERKNTSNVTSLDKEMTPDNKESLTLKEYICVTSEENKSISEVRSMKEKLPNKEFVTFKVSIPTASDESKSMPESAPVKEKYSNKKESSTSKNSTPTPTEESKNNAIPVKEKRPDNKESSTSNKSNPTATEESKSKVTSVKEKRPDNKESSTSEESTPATEESKSKVTSVEEKHPDNKESSTSNKSTPTATEESESKVTSVKETHSDNKETSTSDKSTPTATEESKSKVTSVKETRSDNKESSTFNKSTPIATEETKSKVTSVEEKHPDNKESSTSKEATPTATEESKSKVTSVKEKHSDNKESSTSDKSTPIATEESKSKVTSVKEKHSDNKESSTSNKSTPTATEDSKSKVTSVKEKPSDNKESSTSKESTLTALEERKITPRAAQDKEKLLDNKVSSISKESMSITTKENESKSGVTSTKEKLLDNKLSLTSKESIPFAHEESKSISEVTSVKEKYSDIKESFILKESTPTAPKEKKTTSRVTSDKEKLADNKKSSTSKESIPTTSEEKTSISGVMSIKENLPDKKKSSTSNESIPTKSEEIKRTSGVTSVKEKLDDKEHSISKESTPIATEESKIGATSVKEKHHDNKESTSSKESVSIIPKVSKETSGVTLLREKHPDNEKSSTYKESIPTPTAKSKSTFKVASVEEKHTDNEESATRKEPISTGHEQRKSISRTSSETSQNDINNDKDLINSKKRGKNLKKVTDEIVLSDTPRQLETQEKNLKKVLRQNVDDPSVSCKLEQIKPAKDQIKNLSTTDLEDSQTAHEQSSEDDDIYNDDTFPPPDDDISVERKVDESKVASPNERKREQRERKVVGGKRSRVEELVALEESVVGSSSDGEERREPEGSSDEGESEAGLLGKLESLASQSGRRAIRGRRGRGRGSRGRSRVQRAAVGISASLLSSRKKEDTKKEEVTATPPNLSKPKSNRGKRAPKLMGLDLGVDIVLEQSRGDEEGRPGAPPVRQSRRIAQMKIREEAERRKLEEMTLQQLKEEQSRRRAEHRAEKKESKSEGKKRKKKAVESDEDFTAEDVDEDSSSKKKLKKKKKRRKKKPALSFNESNPWQSSSGSSTSQEEDEEEAEQSEEEEEDDEELVFKSDHEFSPESDLENDAVEIEPTRRARTAQKGLPCEDEEQPTDEHACQKCGKSDHPEWILLCDKCDSGWHGSCLRPALMVIPEGDWFCPPCEHTFLLKNLHNNLLEFDRNWKRRENEELRRKRLAYVGISLDNVLPNKEKEGSGGESGAEMKRESAAATPSETEESGSESRSSSDEDSEPVYQLRQRRQTLFSYRFNEYDDLINSAIQDEMEAVKGAGNQGRGKDIATIVKAEAEAEAEELQNIQKNTEIQEKNIEKSEEKPDKEEPVPEEIDKEEMPPVVPKHDIKDEEDDDEFCPFKKFQSRKKHRRLNSLDISSEDDAESDEDFKGSSSDDDEEDYEGSEGASDDSEITGRRGKGSRRRASGPVRRSSRARITRFDKEFINDDSDDSEPPKKKSRRLWQDSDSEESDASWRRNKKSKKPIPTLKIHKLKNKKKKKKRSKRDMDSDLEVYKTKKPKIKFGGLEEEEELSPTRRTRGRKINYQEIAASDSEEETWGRVRKLDSEDEYVANDDDDEEEEDEVIPELEKDSENEAGTPIQNKINKTKPEKKLKPKKAMKSSPDSLQSSSTPRRGRRATKINKKVILDSEEEEIPPCPGIPLTDDYVDDSNGLACQQSCNTQISELEMQSDSAMLCGTDIVPEDIRGRTRGQGKKPEAQKKKGRRKKKTENNTPDLPESLPAGIQKNDPGMLGQHVDVQVLPSQPKTVPEISGKGTETLVQRLGTSGRRGPISRRSKIELHPEAEQAMLVKSTKGTVETDPLRSLLAAPPVIPPEGEMKINEEVPPPAVKRKGRGRGKAAAADPSKGTDVGHFSPLQNFPASTGVGNAGNSSVITRMLQSQPVSGAPQSFTAAAAAMGHKYFGNSGEPPLMPIQTAGRGSSSVPPYSGPPKGMTSPYRQPPPSDSGNTGIGPGMSHYGSSPSPRGTGVRGPPPGFQQTGTIRLRNPPPSGQAHLFHTSHHPMDPSPSGGGPIIIASSAGPPTPPAGSPLSSKPGTPSTSQNTPTPPPPPYSRPGPQLPLAPPSSTTMAPMMPFPSQTVDSSQPPVRHPPPPFPPSTSASHLQTPQATQQSSPPTHQGRSPVPGNFSPYHPPPPANYHYGGYPPPPPMSAADDALPPSAFQGSPYTDHYTSSDMTANLQTSDGSNSKSYDEEGGGEFGGLVSYFSSQREDDLDT